MKDVKATVNLLINIVMGVVLGVTGQVLNGQFSVLAFAQSFVLSMVILITFFCVFVQAGIAVISVFLHMIGPFLIVGVIAIEISSYWITKIAIEICK